MSGAPREEMIATLKAIVVPRLRDAGFTGAFPHFRRRRDGALDLVTFQFDRHGGGFVVEIGHAPDQPFDRGFGEPVPPSRLTAWDLKWTQRFRIKPPGVTATDFWFRYDAGQFEDAARLVLASAPLAEEWWKSRSA